MEKTDILSIIMENVFSIVLIVSFIIGTILTYKIIQKLKTTNRKKELIFKDFKVGNFMVVMYRKIGDKFHEIDKIRIDIKNKKFRYNNKDFFNFNMQNIAFSDRKNNYYAFDYDSGSQLTFDTKGMPDKISIEDVDIYVNRGLITQLVKGLEDIKPKGQYLMLILGIVLGIVIGFIIGMYLAPKPVETPKPEPIINAILGVLYN